MAEVKTKVAPGVVYIICDHSDTTTVDSNGVYRCTACGTAWIHGVTPGPHPRVEGE